MRSERGISRRHLLEMAGAAGGLALAGTSASWAQAAKRIEQLDPALEKLIDVSQHLSSLGFDVADNRVGGYPG